MRALPRTPRYEPAVASALDSLFGSVSTWAATTVSVSGADVNTAFIAKELDFGALGSSPVARGLPRVSHATRTAPREAARTQQACGI